MANKFNVNSTGSVPSGSALAYDSRGAGSYDSVKQGKAHTTSTGGNGGKSKASHPSPSTPVTNGAKSTPLK
jgi:hypothetical protein